MQSRAQPHCFFTTSQGACFWFSTFMMLFHTTRLEPVVLIKLLIILFFYSQCIIHYSCKLSSKSKNYSVKQQCSTTYHEMSDQLLSSSFCKDHQVSKMGLQGGLMMVIVDVSWLVLIPLSDSTSLSLGSTLLIWRHKDQTLFLINTHYMWQYSGKFPKVLKLFQVTSLF